MAYLSPHFDYDVFVSYSHGDPRGAGESPLKTWSHALIEALIADTPRFLMSLTSSPSGTTVISTPLSS
jgi:hypothetical protein